MMRTLAALGALLIATTFAASPALAQDDKNFCGGFGGSGHPDIKPIIYPKLHFDRSNPGFDCQAWQAFIYLNWPALSLIGTPPGTPNPNANFGAPGTTVWETYPTVDQTFLPGGADPGQWNKALPPPSWVPRALAPRVSAGQVRALSRRSKVSHVVIASLAKAGVDPTVLNSITQAFGGTLYDQQINPVYYEISLNKDQYQYIQQNGLFNANTQLDYAKKTDIVLPSGNTKYGDIGALELKAAWKILTNAEIKSGKFHTAQAIVPTSQKPVTVGLVGLHFFQMLDGTDQGMWATFAQEDNAPTLLSKPGAKQAYTFYNPGCPPTQCPINQESATPLPTQVVQIFQDDEQADGVNKKMKAKLQDYGAGPWQYYKLINVQWPLSPEPLGTAPRNPPLPLGNPNTDTLMNAVLETFLQTKGTSCLGCHQSGSVSVNQVPKVTPSPQNATSYSFMFYYAQAPAAPQ
jgi:hypothetical protein